VFKKEANCCKQWQRSRGCLFGTSFSNRRQASFKSNLFSATQKPHAFTECIARLIYFKRWCMIQLSKCRNGQFLTFSLKKNM